MVRKQSLENLILNHNYSENDLFFHKVSMKIGRTAICGHTQSSDYWKQCRASSQPIFLGEMQTARLGQGGCQDPPGTHYNMYNMYGLPPFLIHFSYYKPPVPGLTDNTYQKVTIDTPQCFMSRSRLPVV